ncbi:MAG: heavy-metal-associated domain-containing protein [Deltaproteobacteria bacterium]|nr:heavy-metal-associated domain-containing protein [Deltaproteobacteria bacterium]MBW1962103.1 heavy-metal-associated domain-containing protein [Deltaproteobacteria bacterium]MBW2151837.1 heavy-metal-associated domain-containing protein [Deltaproteobacteria bacterium]
MRKFNKNTDNGLDHADEADGRMTISFHVEGMSCMACAQKIEKALLNQPGVIEAVVDSGRRKALVSFDIKRINTEDLQGSIRDAGYAVIKDEPIDENAMKIPGEHFAGVYFKPNCKSQLKEN